ncbi:pentatricopeptide repeat-containing protein At5g16420, mitochondrial [Ricinus communis]|uniref:Pentatricopeptide repeat-containing protein, putative n=1 Tax=Ricinus communis TaxID=3988 RepID=B9SBC5_RICCO|nr:pentatricopeptide repeat-containing protein At5g16420, mitochondrial [Ricinus communis]EEF39010.1 pentatricopeptide repeat-containing protein, putative [Ricinus communis]|eukprot:XP_002523294.1 pentatricopeptide repeat-containing protein At5g16420, mitochondrial [Ricinus communis]
MPSLSVTGRTTMLCSTQSRHRPKTTAVALLHSNSTGSPNNPLPESYTVTPPIKPWPQRLYPKRLVSMITRQQNLDLALQIFEYAGKYQPNFSHNYDTYDSIIHKLSRARVFGPVELLLSDLHKSQIKCGENIFINVIRNYGLAGKPDFALRTFIRIQDFNVQRSVRSLNTLLNAFVQNKRYDLVHAMFKNCRSKYGVLPNVFTCNILIKALCKKNDVESAVKVLDEMPAMGMIPNVVTYTTILGGYSSRGDMVNANKVFGELFDRGWLPDATTYTILMNGYCEQGRLADAIKLMDDMGENGVEPNEVTYGVMVEAYCKEKKAGEARNLLDDMLERQYVPSSALCCKVIDVLCEAGKIEEACELWKRMLKKNCMPDNAIMSTLIHWLCKEGKVWEARKLFGEFERGAIPSLLTYNTLIAGMCEKGELSEAGKLWDDMMEKGYKPNAFTYNMLIKGFSKIGNAKEGIRILEEMLDNRCMPNKSTYAILIEELCKMGMEGEVDKVVSMAMASGGVDSDSWDLFLNKAVGNLDRGSKALDSFFKENAQ